MSVLLFAVAVTLHNVEEAACDERLPSAVLRLGVSRSDHRIAIVGLTLAFYIVVGYALSLPTATLAVPSLVGCALVMVVNAFVPHTLVTLVRRRYSAGTLTGLLLVVPAGVGLLFVLTSEVSLGLSTALFAGLVTALVAVALIVALTAGPVMLRRGRVRCQQADSFSGRSQGCD